MTDARSHQPKAKGWVIVRWDDTGKASEEIDLWTWSNADGSTEGEPRFMPKLATLNKATKARHVGRLLERLQKHESALGPVMRAHRRSYDAYCAVLRRAAP